MRMSCGDNIVRRICGGHKLLTFREKCKSLGSWFYDPIWYGKNIGVEPTRPLSSGSDKATSLSGG